MEHVDGHGSTAPLVFTIEEAAALLRICRTSAYEAARTGQIPTIAIGRRRVVPKAALYRMLGFESGPLLADGP